MAAALRAALTVLQEWETEKEYEGTGSQCVRLKFMEVQVPVCTSGLKQQSD